LLVDGRQFYPCMLDAINEAEKFICLETYLIESGKQADRFIEALIAARQRQVSVYLLLDDYGSQGLRSHDRQRLQQSGVQLVFYNPVRLRELFASLHRNHRKLLLIDAKTAFVGGAGIADEFMQPGPPDKSWHEFMLRIEGAPIQDWLDLFARTWQLATRTPSNLPALSVAPAADNQVGRLSLADGRRCQEINRSLIKRSYNAERRIWISTPYFIISRKLRTAMRRAARQGIDVRVLVPGEISDHPWVRQASRGYYSRLLRAGVRIFEYQPRFIHAKLQLCDNWVSVGSSNLDRWNQHWNLDANQEIDDTAFAEKVTAVLQRDFNQSSEIHYADWRIRPRQQRIREWLWGRVVRILEFLSRPQRKSQHRRNT